MPEYANTIARFELIEAIAERIFLRMSSQVAGIDANHEMWLTAYDMFKTDLAIMPMIELSLDLAKEVLSLVDESNNKSLNA